MLREAEGRLSRTLVLDQGSPTSADCPVRRSNPPKAQPANAGDAVGVSASVAISEDATFCFVLFTVMDGDGRVALPGARPVNSRSAWTEVRG